MNQFFENFAAMFRTFWSLHGEGTSLILFAVFSLIAGFYLARLASSIVKRGLRYRRADPELTVLLGRIVRWTIIIFGILFATQQIGVDITAFLTGIGILGFTIGFALQDVSKNFVAGILILMQKPFNLGDKIEVAGFSGVVLDIRLRDTLLRTDDGLRVSIPNGDLFTKPIRNFSRLARRRVQIDVGVAYDSDLEQVRRIALETIKTIPGVLSDPPIEIYFDSFGEYAVQLKIGYWYDETKTNYNRALDAGIAGLKMAFDRAGIMIPVPLRQLRTLETRKNGAQINDRERVP